MAGSSRLAIKAIWFTHPFSSLQISNPNPSLQQHKLLTVYVPSYCLASVSITQNKRTPSPLSHSRTHTPRDTPK